MAPPRPTSFPFFAVAVLLFAAWVVNYVVIMVVALAEWLLDALGLEIRRKRSCCGRPPDGPLELASCPANNELKPGQRQTSPHVPRAVSGRLSARPRLTQIIATAELGRFPHRSDVARTYRGVGVP
jgi:hypothetical protein